VRDLRSAEDGLFDRWSAGRSDFMRDGATDEVAYLAAPRRVVFVLKEAYDKSALYEKVRDNRKFAKEGGIKQTWATLARWAYGLQQLGEAGWDAVDGRASDEKWRSEALMPVAVMNVKKIVSDTSTTSVKALLAWARKPANLVFLKEQWELYAADVTVCGGWAPFEVLSEAVRGPNGTFSRTRGGMRYWEVGKGRFVVESCHPSARVSARLKYERVVEAARELLPD
jgi:hypothetical protein